MGKKGTAGKNPPKDGGQSTQEAKEDPSITGNFINDLPLLCSQKGIPVIQVLRRGDSRSCAQCILVETEEVDSDAVTAIHIRGWFLTEDVAVLLAEALTNCASLTALHFWNAGFSSSVLNIIVQIAADHHVREVSLDGCNVDLTSVVVMINQRRLEKLSLKSCGVDDTFVQGLVEGLSDNTSLSHLNLSCNHITDVGCRSLATCLRLNRTLLSLVLTNNKIQDDGAIALAEILSKFALTHDEVVLHRRLEAKKRKLDEHTQETNIRTASPHSRSPSSLAVDKFKGKGDKSAGSKMRKGDTKKEEKSKKEDKTKKVSEIKKSKPTKDGKTKKSNSSELASESPVPEAMDVTISPLLTDQLLKLSDGYCMAGNLNLLYLGLAYNQIGSAGLLTLQSALTEQNEYLKFGTGILKLSLEHNVPRDRPTTACQECLDQIEQLLTDRLQNLEDSKASASPQSNTIS